MKCDAKQVKSDTALKAAKAYRAWVSRLARKYGITPRQYERMREFQFGVCAICQRPPKKLRLAVDHDHKTGRVRGLLCYTCNRFKVSKNDLASAHAVVRYLDSTFDGRKL